MEKSIDLAAEKFVQLHKDGFLDLDHIKDGYGSVAGFLSAEGQPLGDLGRWSREIQADMHKDGRKESVEWFEDCFQIGYYRLPFEDRITPQDHTPEIYFDPDLGCSLDQIKQLKAQGYYDISLAEVVEGAITESISIEDYIDDWEVA